jgi:hypothetical protein
MTRKNITYKAEYRPVFYCGDGCFKLSAHTLIFIYTYEIRDRVRE